MNCVALVCWSGAPVLRHTCNCISICTVFTYGISESEMNTGFGGGEAFETGANQVFARQARVRVSTRRQASES